MRSLMIYLDANIFLHPLLANDSKSEGCIALLEKVGKGEIEAGTSPLTWDEFYYTLKNKLWSEKTLTLSEDFLNTPNLLFLDATEQIIRFAHDLTKDVGLKPRDAIHAATAILNGCKEIMSDDKDFDVVKELKRIAP